MPHAMPLTGEFYKWSPTCATKPAPNLEAWAANGDGRYALTSEPKLTPTASTLASYFAHSSAHAKVWTPSKDDQLRAAVTSAQGTRRAATSYGRHCLPTNVPAVDWSAVARDAKIVGTTKESLERRYIMLTR